MSELWRAKVVNAHVEYEAWRVTKETPKGHWLEGPYGEVTWRARATYFASPTKEEALQHLQIRKRRYVKHSRRRYEEAQRQLAVALEGSLKDLIELDGRIYPRGVVLNVIDAGVV